jgi:hypothetical protein
LGATYVAAQPGLRSGAWPHFTAHSAGIIKKSPAGPVKRLEKELRRHCRVVSVDEHLTSKLHSCCHHRMKQMYQKRMCRDGVMRSVRCSIVTTMAAMA